MLTLHFSACVLSGPDLWVVDREVWPDPAEGEAASPLATVGLAVQLPMLRPSDVTCDDEPIGDGSYGYAYRGTVEKEEHRGAVGASRVCIKVVFFFPSALSVCSFLTAVAPFYILQKPMFKAMPTYYDEPGSPEYVELCQPWRQEFDMLCQVWFSFATLPVV